MAENTVFLSAGYYPDPAAGRPISNGSIYIGVADLDPTVEANRVIVELLDEDSNVIQILPAAQPIKTGAGGVPLYNGSPVQITVSDTNYSLAVHDSVGSQIYYIANSNTAGGIVTTGNALNNRFRNSGMVATFNNPATLSTTLTEGEVSGVYGAIADFASGTLSQEQRNDIGSQGYAAVISGLGANANGEAWFAVDLPRSSVYDLVEQNIAVQAVMRHDYTGSREAYFELYCPNSVDDFSALTLIATSKTTTITSALKTNVNDVIDASTLAQKALIANGLQVRFILEVGSSSNNEVAFSDFSLNLSSSVPAYVPYPDEIQETVNIGKILNEGALPANYIEPRKLKFSIAGTTGTITQGLYKTVGNKDADLSADIQKTLNTAWSDGDTGGARASAVTFANDTWYRVFLISKEDKTADWGIDSSATATNLLADAASAGYTQYRQRSWAYHVAAGVFLTMRQGGDFDWNYLITATGYPIDFSSGTLATSKTAIAATAPINSIAKLQVSARKENGSNGTAYILISSANDVDVAASETTAFTVSARKESSSGNYYDNDASGVEIETDGTNQIFYRSSQAGCYLEVFAIGFEYLEL